MNKLKERFKEKFVRKSLNPEDKGEYQWRWFIKETTAEDMWKFFEEILKEQRKDLMQKLENHIDKFISLQEKKEGITEEDALNLQMGLEAFLLSFKLKKL